MHTLGTFIGGALLGYLGQSTLHYLREQTSARLPNRQTAEWLREKLRVAGTRSVEQESTGWNGYRQFVVDRKVRECRDVVSLYLEPFDRKSIPSFHSGQFVTLRLAIPGQDRPVVRCYTISSPPNDGYYRITVKRDPGGTASGFLNESVAEGDVLDLQAPRGDFHIDPSLRRPIVLIAGGIGITPFLSMTAELSSADPRRSVHLFHVVRDGRDHCMKDELRRLEKRFPGLRVYSCYSRPTRNDRPGRDFDFRGRLSIDTLRKALPSSDGEYFLCGSTPMVQSAVKTLKSWNVPDQRIHSESFGSGASSVAEIKGAPAECEPTPVESGPVTPEDTAKETARITFSESGKTVCWDGADGNLLNLAHRHGVNLRSGCSAGMCGACQTSIRSGNVRYSVTPGFSCDRQACLPCVAVPEGDVVLGA